MSTSTLGREERKPMMDSFVLQRRILFGCAICLGLGLIGWIIAVASDHWLIVSGDPGIYIPESRRYFKSSHRGLWRVCRYGLIPHPLPNSTIARSFITVSGSNIDRIVEIKKNVSDEPFIANFLMSPDHKTVMENTTEVNEVFRQHLFGRWVTNDSKFSELRDKYKSLIQQSKYNIEKFSTNPTAMHVNPSNLTEIRGLIGDSLKTVNINGTETNIMVPPQIEYALFDDWEDKKNIPFLLWSFARDMNISVVMLINNGTNFLVIRPPVPPKRGNTGNGFEYIKFHRCNNHDMFPTESEIIADPSIDTEIINYSRTEASFACITVLVMIMGFFFSIYTFLNPRYMFKRLAGGINFISGSTSLVVIQVVAHSIDYERDHIAYAFPGGATYSYGYAFYVAYIVCAINFISGLMFMCYSRKKKGSKAPTEEMGMADEPTIIGR